MNTIEQALEDIKNGKMVVVVDDEDRENEGDLIIASRFASPEAINFMSKEARGLICIALTEDRCKELQLDLMVKDNTASHETPFTVSVDLIGEGCTTGISAHDRSKTIFALLNPLTRPQQLGRPGHIFPLRARRGGVLKRTGHTEAAVDLSQLAGLEQSGVLVEIMNDDGTMARLPQLLVFAQKHQLKIITIKDLVAYKMLHGSFVEQKIEVQLPTKYGNFVLKAFEDIENNQQHFALCKGSWKAEESVLTRVHSSCFTGDILHSLRCDCGEQLNASLEMIEAEGKGVLLYMNQEGRGIGLMNKLKAYQLQEQGLDTVEANLHLGFKADERDYGVGAQILRALGIKKMKLISNNPIKRKGLEGYGLEITACVPIKIVSNAHNKTYLATKKNKLGHDLD